MHLVSRRLPSALLAVLTVGSAGRAGAQLTLDELYSSPQIIGTAPKAPVWSPDSSRLAFLWNDAGLDIYDVWLSSVAMPGPVRITHSESSVTDVSWYPDGDALLFERDGTLYRVREGEQPTEITRGTGARFSAAGQMLFLRDGGLWVRGDDDERLLVGDERREIWIESYRLSADGAMVAVLEIDERRVPLRGIPDYLQTETTIDPVRRPFPGEEPRSQRLGISSLSGDGTVQWIDLGAPPPDPVFSYRWSRDGALLVDRSDLYVKSRRIVRVEPATGQVTEMVREDDEDNVTANWQAEWAPDGRGIYFLSDRDDDYHIYQVTEPGGAAKRITEGEFAVARFTVTDDAIYYVANAPKSEERHLFRVGLAGGASEQWTTMSGTHDPVIAPDGRHAADMFSSDTMPPELFLVSASEEIRLTESPLPAFYEQTWVRPRYVTFPSHVDGVTLHGRLLVPANFDEQREYPAIMGSVYANTVRNQWGGRNAHPLWGLDQVLVQRGYVVFSVDVRGSWGHGRAFRRGIRLDYGGIDVEDLESGVHYLESLGYVDSERIGIWGSSYGGLLAAMSLFKKPGLYAAGIAAAPATNVFHALTGEMRVMMAPQDEPERYEAASAFSHAEGLRDPLLIIHGMRDRVVLYKDTLALVEKLLELGKNVDLVTLPRAGHAWDREDLDQTRFAFKKVVEYFDRHVKGTGR